jgi:hypothetical protein
MKLSNLSRVVGLNALLQEINAGLKALDKNTPVRANVFVIVQLDNQRVTEALFPTTDAGVDWLVERANHYRRELRELGVEC